MPRSRFVLFDSLRALAALGVLLFHAGTFSRTNVTWYGGLTAHLNVGVTLFFLISGFLLYRPQAEALLEGSVLPAILPYARRRFLRIVPAYWVALTLFACWPGLEGVFTSKWWVYYGFLQSYDLEWTFTGISPAWSLSVEMAFYAVLPLVGILLTPLCLGRTRRQRARIQFGALALAGIVGLLLHAWILGANLWNFYNALPSFLAWFATGMSMAVANVWFAGREPRPRWIHFVVNHPGACWILAFVIYLGIAWSPAFPRPFDGRQYTPSLLTIEHVLYLLVALLVMLPAVFGESSGGWPRRLLASRTLTQLGTVSYGVFLWHWSLLIAAVKLGALRLVPSWPMLSLLLPTIPLTLICALLSYRVIERPAMRLGARSR